MSAIMAILWDSQGNEKKYQIPAYSPVLAFPIAPKLTSFAAGANNPREPVPKRERRFAFVAKVDAFVYLYVETAP